MTYGEGCHAASVTYEGLIRKVDGWGMMRQMRVAVIGDNFVGVELFEEALRRHVQPLVEDLSIVSMHVPWPDVPLVENAEVKEFLGDPQQVAALVEGATALLTHVGR